MKRETKIFEKKLIRERNRIERIGLTMIKRALIQQYRSFYEKAKEYTPDKWIEATEYIKPNPITDFFEKFYPMSASLALMNYKHLKNEKADDELWLSIFHEKMTLFMRGIAGEKITSITSTSQDRIKGIIRSVLEQAELEGLGIEKTTNRLVRAVGSDLSGNVVARARAIAQTEMIGASNYANQESARATGLNFRRFWSTSGLPGIRDTHIFNEQYSDQNNGLSQDEPYPNGLMFPGDPNGSVEEVINCRCTELHEIV